MLKHADEEVALLVELGEGPVDGLAQHGLQLPQVGRLLQQEPLRLCRLLQNQHGDRCGKSRPPKIIKGHVTFYIPI